MLQIYLNSQSSDSPRPPAQVPCCPATILLITRSQKLYNYSSSQERIWGVQHVTTFSKVHPASIRCVSEWMKKWGIPSTCIYNTSSKVKRCEGMQVFTGLHCKITKILTVELLDYELWSVVELVADTSTLQVQSLMMPEFTQTSPVVQWK